jgi:hypothetical protein
VSDLYLALLHHPVLDKNGVVVTTAVTNMDIHDISRSACTYGVRRFFVVTPVRALRKLAAKIIEHWQTGFGSTYNVTRKQALGLVALETDLDATLIAVERECGRRPTVVVTSAHPGPVCIGYDVLRQRLELDDEPYLILLGTGWGLTPAVMAMADLRLGPILGPGTYNHLSVRAAAAVILDRLCGER